MRKEAISLLAPYKESLITLFLSRWRNLGLLEILKVAVGVPLRRMALEDLGGAFLGGGALS